MTTGYSASPRLPHWAVARSQRKTDSTRFTSSATCYSQAHRKTHQQPSLSFINVSGADHIVGPSRRRWVPSCLEDGMNRCTEAGVGSTCPSGGCDNASLSDSKTVTLVSKFTLMVRRQLVSRTYKFERRVRGRLIANGSRRPDQKIDFAIERCPKRVGSGVPWITVNLSCTVVEPLNE